MKFHGFFCLMVFCTPLLMAEESPELKAGIRVSDFVLDGRLQESSWQAIDAIDGLTTVEPVAGAEPAERTTVRVIADAKNIVFGIQCLDRDPAGIVTYSKARDAELEEEDHVRIVLDPFQDGRTGYVFAVNPGGARYDALIAARGEGEDRNWDGIWQAATHRDASGWSVEIVIPVQSLSFKKGQATWNFNIERRIQRLQETSRWASPDPDYEITQTSRAGRLTGLPVFDLGFGLSIRPSFTGGATNPSRDAETDYEGDPSLDVTKKLGPSVLSSLTINTDFAETEVDERQFNLTRFDLFFPEKRTFFLEGSDIFEFGIGVDQDAIPFFSRRIGLVDDQEIPLRVGGKVNGRVGRTNFGFLSVHAGEVEDLVNPADMGVARIKQDIFEESSVGMIATFGDPENLEQSWLAGVDFTYQTSEFLGDKNFLAGAWGMLNGREDLQGEKSAWGFKLDYPNDLWDIALKYKRVGDGFDPSLGFVPQKGVHIYAMGIVYSPRPGWKHVRQMFHETFVRYVTDLDGAWQSYEAFFLPLNWQMESGDRFEFAFSAEGDRPDEPFEVGGVTIETGSYRWNRYGVELETAEKRKVAMDIGYSWGDFYDGSLSSTAVNLQWNPGPLVTLDFSLDHFVGKLSGGDFTEDLLGARVRLNLSPDLNVSSLVQYDTESDSLGANTRMRWTLTPYLDLFVIYNHNLLNTENRWIRESNQILIKLQYTFRK